MSWLWSRLCGPGNLTHGGPAALAAMGPSSDSSVRAEYLNLVRDVRRYYAEDLMMLRRIWRTVVSFHRLVHQIIPVGALLLSAAARCLLQIGLKLSSYALLVLLIGLAKAIQPRFNFRTSDPINLEEPQPQQLHRLCSLSLNQADVQAVYRHLSWSQTQLDFESLSWFNRSLASLWPSIRTVANGFIVTALHSSAAKRLNTSKQAVQLSKKKASLSVLLSCRRKLDRIRKSHFDRTKNPGVESTLRDTLLSILGLIKEALIYCKQFVLDSIISLSAANHKPASEEWPQSADAETSGARLGCDRTIKSCPTLPTRQLLSQPKLPKSASNVRNCKNHKMPKQMSNRFLGPKSMLKWRNQRLKLASSFDKSNKQLDGPKICIDRIKLGGKPPIISGIKYIANNKSKLANSTSVASHLSPSDDENMRFITELVFEGGDGFCVQLSSVPLLGRLQIDNIKVQLRLMVTLNHTTVEFNRDMKIFDTPGDVLFPAINHTQICLLDAPMLDWNLKKIANQGNMNLAATASTSSSTSLINFLKTRLHPVDLINHDYFKFIVHVFMYRLLRWFQPFDIKVDHKLYLRTMC